MLIAEDTYWAVVGMLALFQIGAEVVMPQNATMGASAAIRKDWDLLVCDRLPTGQSQGFQLRIGEGGIHRLLAMDPAHCRMTLFTSGSTGEPKSVSKTLDTMEREAAAIEEILGEQVPRDARVFGTVTHQHLFGLSYKLFWPLCSGRCIDGPVYALWEDLLTENLAGAAIVSSPAHLTRLGTIDAVPEANRPACLLSAGAELPVAASVAASKAFGTPLCEIYGSTETGTIAFRWRDRMATPWQPMPGVAIDIGEGDILSLTSPFLPDQQAYRTSDRVVRDADGGFHLVGRDDRIVKIDGKRVSLSQVETQLTQSPLVSASAVLPLLDDQTVLVAVVVPSESGAEELRRLGAFRVGRLLRHFLGEHQEAAGKPRRWRFVDRLPVNDMGKLRKEDLLALFSVTGRPTEPELRTVRRHDSGVELDLFNSPDLAQLDGHFPNMPIIPGVAQIDWAVKLAARHLNLPIEVATHYQVKFHRLTLPGTLVTLKLAHDAVRQRLNFSYHRDDVVLTSGAIKVPLL
nr:AMP-binding protein [uncultured Dongia sp.]